MLSNTTVCHLRIAFGQAPKRDKQLGMFDDVLQRRLLQFHLRPRRDDMRQYHLGGRRAVGVHSTRAATHQIQEAMQLRLCVVKTTRTGPSIRSAKYRLVAVLIGDTFEFVGGQF